MAHPLSKWTFGHTFVATSPIGVNLLLPQAESYYAALRLRKGASVVTQVGGESGPPRRQIGWPIARFSEDP